MKINLQLFAKKVTDSIVQDVINGKYGNGQARKTALANAGYDYSEVQSLVNAKLGGTSSKTPTASATSTPATTPAATTAPSVKTSDNTNSLLNNVQASELELKQLGDFTYEKPTSAYETYIKDVFDKLNNREKFSYDLNGDALYQQYKDQYMLQGQQAMMDTMGQVAAMNGGYGNSYAQTVGQQTYQGYLQQLNDRIPELYQLALNQYNQEGQDLKDLYALYTDMDDRKYERDMDDINMQYNLHNDKVTKLENAITRGYDNYWQSYGYDYQFGRDAVEDANTQQAVAYDKASTMLGFGIMPEADLLAAAGISSKSAQAMVNKVKEQESAAATAYASANKPKSLSVDDHDKIITQLQAYQDSGDNKKLASYLDSLVAAGTISEEYADTLYSAYLKKIGPEPATANQKLLAPEYGKKVTR